MITVSALSGPLSNALLHIIQGLEQLGINVITNNDFQEGGGESSVGGASVFPPYSITSPTRFRQSHDQDDFAKSRLLFVEVTFVPTHQWHDACHQIEQAMASRSVIVFNMADNCTLMDYPAHWIVFSANHSKHAQRSMGFLCQNHRFLGRNTSPSI